jgi:hypothetical protein
VVEPEPPLASERIASAMEFRDAVGCVVAIAALRWGVPRHD